MNLVPFTRSRNLFEDFFKDFDLMERSLEYPTHSKVNVLDKKDHFEIVALTPGLSKEDLSISLKDGVLTIKGEHKTEDLKKEDRYIYNELTRNSFSRSFKLDTKTIDGDKITSTYVNGELKITIPKKEKEEEKTYKINIS